MKNICYIILALILVSCGTRNPLVVATEKSHTEVTTTVLQDTTINKPLPTESVQTEAPIIIVNGMPPDTSITGSTSLATFNAWLKDGVLGGEIHNNTTNTPDAYKAPDGKGGIDIPVQIPHTTTTITNTETNIEAAIVIQTLETERGVLMAKNKSLTSQLWWSRGILALTIVIASGIIWLMKRRAT